MCDLARYLASRAVGLDPDALCAARGYRVIEADISEPGFCLRRHRPAIVVRLGAPAQVRAHEAFHCIVWENTSLGISYEPPEWESDTEEAAADRFAAYLAAGEEAC